MKLVVYRTIRKLRDFLHTQPEITKTKILRGSVLQVHFSDDTIESWHYRTKPQADSPLSFDISTDQLEFDQRFPKFRCQFTHNPLDEEDSALKHFKYTHGYLNRFKFPNVRIFIHRLAADLSNEGYVDIWYPQRDLQSRINRFAQEDLAHLRTSKTHYRTCGMSDHVFLPLLYSCLDLREISNIDDVWCDKELFVAINRLYNSARTAITRTSVITTMRKCQFLRLPRMPVLTIAKIMRDWFPGMGINNMTNWPWLKFVQEINRTRSCDVPFTDDPNVALRKRPVIYWGELDAGVNISIRSINTHFLTIIY